LPADFPVPGELPDETLVLARALALSTCGIVLTVPAMVLAADISTVNALTQSEFRSLSEDLVQRCPTSR